MIVSGVALLAYLYKKNPAILNRITNDIKASFNSNEITVVPTFHPSPSGRLVINAKNDEHIGTAVSFNSSQMFKDFVNALHSWQPRGAYYEYELQDRLYRHLKKNMPGASIEMEYPVGSAELANRGRADIVINRSILLEMKRDDSAGAIQRAKGQISQYSDIWKGKGPVVLVLCDFDYTHADLAFHSTMVDLAKLERSVLTIVAKPK